MLHPLQCGRCGSREAFTKRSLPISNINNNGPIWRVVCSVCRAAWIYQTEPHNINLSKGEQGR